MKAFKGCINENCKAYKEKRRYKKDDQYCLQCGNALSFVCADCWKPMEKDKKRYCISCEAEKEQKKAQVVEKAKVIGGGAMGAMGAVAGLAAQIGNNTDKIAKGLEKAGKAGEKIAKMIKK